MSAPTVIIALPEFNDLAKRLVKQLNNPEVTHGAVNIHPFPDQETAVRLLFDCAHKNIILFASLNNPNQKILPLLFLAQTCRDLGAKKIGFICPYLAYMRQDKRFQTGEGISAHYFARLLSDYVDWLITVDPHLHRIHDLNEIYRIPTQVLHATDLISEWINQHITQPIIIGPDQESLQWVQAIASVGNHPYVILEKHREGDKAVHITLPDMSLWAKHTPVLVDDIISSGQTLIQTIKGLTKLGYKAPVCIATHGIFAEDAYTQLQNTGARIVSTNSILHQSNQSNEIDLIPLIAHALLNSPFL